VGLVIGKVHLTKSYARYRVRGPSSFKKESFRTISLKHGLKAVIGVRRNGVSSGVQAILVPKRLYRKGTRIRVNHRTRSYSRYS
jgi:hypothetical protein